MATAIIQSTRPTKPIVNSTLFTSVQTPENIIAVIPELPSYSHTGKANIKVSPLKSVITIKFEQNIFYINVTISNSNNYEWFIPLNDSLTYFLEDNTVIRRETNGTISSLPEGMYERVTPSDANYRLVRPGETIIFSSSISAKEIYDNWPRQNVFILYNAIKIPPSIDRRLREIHGNDQAFGVVLNSNKVRIRCYEYDQNQNRYLCDWDN